MTLQQAVQSGKVDAGQLVAVREVVHPDGTLIGGTPKNAAGNCPAATADKPISDPAAPGGQVVGSTVKLTAASTNCDTAVFSAALDAYDVTINADGSITVADKASAAGLAAGDPFPGGDGIDTLWNVENLRFCIHNDPVSKECDAFQDMSVSAPAAPTGVSAVAGNAQATLNWNILAGNPDGITSFNILVLANGVAQAPVNDVPLTPACNVATGACTRTMSGLINGTSYTFQVVAVNRFGTATSDASAPVTPVNPAPVVTATTPAANATNVVTTADITATFDKNVAGVSATTFQVRRVSNRALVTGTTVTYNSTTKTATLHLSAANPLLRGVQYRAILTGSTAANPTVGIRNALNGAPLEPNPTTWTFTTDNTRPTVFTGAGTLTKPAAGATGVAKGDDVVTEFSEGMLGISGTTVQLRTTARNRLVTAVVTPVTDPVTGRTRAVLDPSADLAANTQYTLALTGGANALRDLSGNTLVSVTRTFTTGP